MKLFNKDEFIANEIRFKIIKNGIKEGDKIPSERELSEEYDAQRATIRLALLSLEEEGLLERVERKGYFVSHDRINNQLNQIKSFSDKVSEMGMDTENRLLSFERIEVDKNLSKKMHLQIGVNIYKIIRLRKVIKDNTEIPIAIEYSYIPESIAPKLMKYDLEENSLFDILINEYKHMPSSEEQSVEVVYATDFEAKMLKVNKMTALVKKSGITYDKNKNIIQFLHSIWNKDWVQFEEVDMKIAEKMKEGLYGL